MITLTGVNDMNAQPTVDMKTLPHKTRYFLAQANISISASAGTKVLTGSELDELLNTAKDRQSGQPLSTVDKMTIKLSLLNAGLVRRD